MFKATKFDIDAPEMAILKVVLEDFAVNTANERKTSAHLVLLELYENINTKHPFITKDSTMKLKPSQAVAMLELMERPTTADIANLHEYNNLYNRLDRYRTTFDILDPFGEAKEAYEQMNNPLLDWTRE